MLTLYNAESLKSLATSAYTEITPTLLQDFCGTNDIPLDTRLRILLLGTPLSGGVGFYRLYQPAQLLNEVYGDKVVALSSDRATPELLMGWANVIVVSRLSHPEMFMFLRRTSAARVYELDDLIHDVAPENRAYRDWGKDQYRYWWSQAILGECDYLQTSTRPLLDLYGGKVKRRGVILENALDLRQFPDPYPRTMDDSRPIRIGWQGSATHLKDLQMIREALVRIQREYGAERVKFIFMGFNGRYENRIGEKVDALQGLERKSYGGHPIETGDYYRTLRSLDLDIALAPLEDTAFNRCKSNLKTLEYGACGYATVASNVTPYRWLDTGGDLSPGLLVSSDPDEWYRAIKIFIEHPDLRRFAAENLRRAVEERYDIQKRIQEHYDFYRSIA